MLSNVNPHRKPITDADRRRTVPWGRDQYATVDGELAVYSVENRPGDPADRITVHLRGGISATVRQLRDRHHVVQLPDKLRIERFA